MVAVKIYSFLTAAAVSLTALGALVHIIFALPHFWAVPAVGLPFISATYYQVWQIHRETRKGVENG